MSEEVEVIKPREGGAAAGFDRPLLLTPQQDIVGVVRGLLGRGALTLVASFTILAVLLIFFYIVRNAWPFFEEQGLVEFFGSDEWHPTHDVSAEYGIQGFLAGSALVTVGAMAIAVPLGLLAAVFLSDIVPFGIRQVVKPVVEILAAIPSVALGFFAILVVAPWLQNTMGLESGANALNASVLLAVMAIPTIVSISEDALSAVGRDLREGAYALGATRAEVLIKVVVPAAHSGIIAAVILGVMRAVGETMLVWMAAGNATGIPHPWWDLSQSVGTQTAIIAAEMAEAPKGSTHYHSLFACGLVLLVVTFGLNLLSEYFLAKSKRALRGGAR
jgi:phosphate ABC transporter permease protein PstC